MTRKTGIQKRKGCHAAGDMLQAIKLYREGASLRRAAQKFNLKFSTVRRYALKHAHVSNENLKYQRLTPNYGINKIFTAEQEEALKTFLKECAAKYDGLTNKEIRRAAYEMAVAYNVEVPVNWRKNKTAGLEWLRAFRCRDAEFLLKKSRDNTRAAVVDEEAVRVFCDAHRIEDEEDPFKSYHDCKVEVTLCEEEHPELPAELHKIEEESPTSVWSYFEREPNGRACCAVCRTVVPRPLMKSHLKENHPKLVFEVTLASEDEASEPQEDVYTEIVYLEDEQNPKRTPKTEKKKPRQSNETGKPKKLHVSSSSDEEPLQLKRSKKEEKEDEIEQFGKYVTCLLKKVPPEACMELQMEIVNLIMKKQLELKKKDAETAKVDAETKNGESSSNGVRNLDDSATPATQSFCNSENC